MPEAVSNRRRVVALDSGPSGNWESCSARRSFLTFGIFGWTWYHSSGLVKPCFVVVRQIWCIYIYKYLARIYLKSKAQRRKAQMWYFFLNADVATLGFSCKKATFFSDARSTPRRLGENLKKGELRSERDCKWLVLLCFRHLWLRMLTKFAAKVLVFMACFGLKRVHNHGSQQCIRFQKQTLDLKIHSLINRPSLSFVLWKRSPTSFIEDEKGDHRLCLFSDSTWHFLNIFCIVHMSQRMPSKNLQALDMAPNFCRFGWDIAHHRASMNMNEPVVSHGVAKEDPILVCKSYIITAFQEVSLWKSNFFIQTTMMQFSHISQDVSISRSLLRSNGWRVPWRLSGGASVHPPKCRRSSHTSFGQAIMANLDSPRTVRLEVRVIGLAVYQHPAILGKWNCNHHQQEKYPRFIKVWDRVPRWLPSWEPTYPTRGRGKSSSQEGIEIPWDWILGVSYQSKDCQPLTAHCGWQKQDLEGEISAMELSLALGEKHCYP